MAREEGKNETTIIFGETFLSGASDLSLILLPEAIMQKVYCMTRQGMLVYRRNRC